MIKEVNPADKYAEKAAPVQKPVEVKKEPEQPKKVEELKSPNPLQEAPAGPYQNANKKDE